MSSLNFISRLVLKSGQKWERQNHYLPRVFIKTDNFPKFTQNLAQISQKVYEPGLYFWFMRKPQTRSWLCLIFETFHGVFYISHTEKLEPWWIVGGLWLRSLFQWYTHTHKFPEQKSCICSEANWKLLGVLLYGSF